LAKILVFNNDTDRMETYYRGLQEPMPYNVNRTLLVREFRGASRSNTLWTTKRTMTSWNSQRRLWGAPIPVGYAFRRPWEGGHAGQSQHYAGTAFDVAQLWTNEQRARLRTSAQNSGLWSYIEPVSISPTWVHFDKRALKSACSSRWISSSKTWKCWNVYINCSRRLKYTRISYGWARWHFWSTNTKCSSRISKKQRSICRWNCWL